MNKWINHPLTLQGKNVLLEPLQEKHFEALAQAAQAEIIWQFMPVKGYEPDKLLASLNEALAKRDSGEQYPFVVIDKKTNQVIGSTRFLQINPEHRHLEIGYTWYAPQYWARGYNEECKLLLLTHCFEVLKTIRVQLIASHVNLRSRKAIERIGATFEGVLRNVIIRNGEKKSIAYYSILEEDWETVKPGLAQLCADKYAVANVH